MKNERKSKCFHCTTHTSHDKSFCCKSLQTGRCVNKKCVILEFELGDTMVSELRIIILSMFILIWEYRSTENHGVQSLKLLVKEFTVLAC